MVAAKQSGKRKWHMSWMSFFIAASVVLNIGFVVFITTMITSHVLDGMIMTQGLNRYCDQTNDDKFSSNTQKVQALRNYTCARGDAEQYFKDGFQKYLDYKHITS